MEYRQRLSDAIKASKGDGKPIFLTWGWNEADHGPMTRKILDAIEDEKPVMVWQRSIHEAVYNTAALNYMKITKADTDKFSATEANFETGHFLEAGFFELAILRLASYLLSSDFMDPGYARVQDYLASNGVTTVGDLATGQMSWDLELGALTRNYVDKKAPFRSVLVPAAHALALSTGGLEKSFAFVDGKLAAKDSPPQIVYGKRIKLLSDGAMFSQLMQALPPGYIDGHHGEWITPKEDFEAQARKYWNAGYRIHVHSNGDKGISYTLDVFETLQEETPRLPGALVIEHFGFANDSLNKRIAALGATVSANPYYLTALGDGYSVDGLGTDRARRIVSLSGLVERGVTVTLHSDFGMAPASPLFLAWSAITRQTLAGKVFTPPRGLTREEALRAITVDAANILGLESDLGSIQSGKLADFAILEADPTEVPIEELKNMPVWGVMFEGEVHKAK
ncbi:MAG: amidohydrolase family protein [Hyphomicrobiales bacterium]|nr:amidohydrolase family protein [Hyphomicrobiales bacterium]